MRDLAILTFVTLDGVMQGPGSPNEDRSGGFDRGGWAGPYWQEVMDQVQREAMAAPYDILFGRKTYELFAAYWPTVGDESPVGKMMNDATKYVATNSLSEPGWKNARFISGDVPEQIAALKQQDGPLLQVHGSWQLIQTLMAHDLIDEYRVWTFPVIVGTGKRLFDEGTAPASLTLVKTEPCSNGVVMNIHRRQAG